MKFDQELYKKEKELEKIRQNEQKKKIKQELDKQTDEKKFIGTLEKKDEFQYNDIVKKQIEIYDKNETDKTLVQKNKIMQESSSRDKQMQEEKIRKKVDLKKEKEFDNILVTKIR